MEKKNDDIIDLDEVLTRLNGQNLPLDEKKQIKTPSDFYALTLTLNSYWLKDKTLSEQHHQINKTIKEVLKNIPSFTIGEYTKSYNLHIHSIFEYKDGKTHEDRMIRLNDMIKTRRFKTYGFYILKPLPERLNIVGWMKYICKDIKNIFINSFKYPFNQVEQQDIIENSIDPEKVIGALSSICLVEQQPEATGTLEKKEEKKDIKIGAPRPPPSYGKSRRYTLKMNS